MRVQSRLKYCIAAAFFLAAQAAFAAPVTWVLTNVQFDDGAIATGSFVSDSGFGTNVQITVSGGSTDISGFGLLSADPFMYTESGITFGGTGLQLTEVDAVSGPPCVEPTGIFYCVRKFVVMFSTPLPDNASVGTTVAFDLTQPAFERFSYNNSDPSAPRRNIISGSVTAVPVPAAVWLFGSALAGLGWRARKRFS